MSFLACWCIEHIRSTKMFAKMFVNKQKVAFLTRNLSNHLIIFFVRERRVYIFFCKHLIQHNLQFVYIFTVWVYFLLLLQTYRQCQTGFYNKRQWKSFGFVFFLLRFPFLDFYDLFCFSLFFYHYVPTVLLYLL